MITRRCPSIFALAAALVPTAVGAAELPATPADYQQVLGQLAPGDTMVLEAGAYPRLSIDGINGTADAWISIRGPADGSAVITSESCCNTVQIENSSYLAIEGLTVDLGGLAVDGFNAKSSVTHHIRLEGNRIEGFPEASQQIVGINTKATAYAWEIVGNTIVSPGTGLYLGNSDGNAPFIAGTIERNLVTNAVGYCMQIKHQNPYDAPEGLGAGPHRTVIAGNVFIKDDTPSPDGARPNLLVGGFPDQGDGAEDVYEIYGNFLFYNPAESLFQGTGRISMHDNVMVGTRGTAIALTSHQGHDVRLAHVYNNTIYGVGTGVSLSGDAPQGSAIVGNLIFADTPISGGWAQDEGNLVAAVADAAQIVNNPSATLGEMDFYPRVGTAVGEALDLSAFAEDAAYDRDFNGQSKEAFVFRGAYAGEGDNPGCPLEASIDCTPPDDGGDDGDSGEDGDDADGDGDGSGDDGSDGTVDDEGPDGGDGFGSEDDGATGVGPLGDGADGGGGDGCGCRTAAPTSAVMWVLPLLVAVRRRQR